MNFIFLRFIKKKCKRKVKNDAVMLRKCKE